MLRISMAILIGDWYVGVATGIVVKMNARQCLMYPIDQQRICTHATKALLGTTINVVVREKYKPLLPSHPHPHTIFCGSTLCGSNKGGLLCISPSQDLEKCVPTGRYS